VAVRAQFRVTALRSEGTGADGADALQIMMKLDLVHNDQSISLSIDRDGDGWLVRLPGGDERRIAARRLPDGMLHIQEADHAFRVAVGRVDGESHVSYDGQLYIFRAPAAEGLAAPTSKSTGELTAPMPGVVADVLVRVGDLVEAYQPVAIVEAMKVMATIEAPFAGRVEEVLVAKGGRVAQGERLAVISPEGSDDV
jgi:biotin carboxyl carrier protein